MSYATNAIKQTVSEKEMWVMNDEGLYNWWRRSGKSKRDFIRENSDELDRIITEAIHKPPQD